MESSYGIVETACYKNLRYQDRVFRSSIQLQWYARVRNECDVAKTEIYMGTMGLFRMLSICGGCACRFFFPLLCSIPEAPVFQAITRGHFRKYCRVQPVIFIHL